MKELIQELSNNELDEIFGFGICICSEGMKWKSCPDKDTCIRWCNSHNGVRSWSTSNSLDADKNGYKNTLAHILKSIFHK